MRSTDIWGVNGSLPRLVWDNVEDQVIRTPHGYIVFDDTVLDKHYSFAIELVR